MALEASLEVQAAVLAADEMAALMDEFREILKSVDQQPSRVMKKRRLGELEAIAQQIRTARETFQLELRSLEAEDKEKFRLAFDQRTNEFRNLLNSFEWKKSELSRDETVERENAALAAAEAASVEEEARGVEGMTREQVVSKGDELQDKTQASIKRMKSIVGETEQIGNEINDTLDYQTAQMLRTQEKLNDVEHNLNRAKRTMKSIAKNAASDRCTQILCCLVVLFFIAAATLIALPSPH